MLNSAKMHAFEFAWGPISDVNIRQNLIPPTPHRQLIGVRVEFTRPYQPESPNRSEALFSPTKSFPSSELRGGKMESLNGELGEREIRSLLTVPVIVGVAAVSFLVGFFSA